VHEAATLLATAANCSQGHITDDAASEAKV